MGRVGGGGGGGGVARSVALPGASSTGDMSLKHSPSSPVPTQPFMSLMLHVGGAVDCM